MSFTDAQLSQNRPASVRDIALPRRERYHPSPADWRDETLYFLLPDRFSDGQEQLRPLLDRRNPASARPALPNGEAWRWDRWAQSGAERWQGGTLRGVRSKLGYLKNLGITAIWIGPVFKQRGHLDTYHGYGIQDFLDVDPHFGDRRDMVELVADAHAAGLRIILDVIFNHSGSNWLYPPETPGGPFMPRYTSGRYPFGSWRGDLGQPVAQIQSREDGVWPIELTDAEDYTRAGAGDLGAGDLDDPQAEHRRSDFYDLRDFRLDRGQTLNDLTRCYKYWIALTDCDGFRIDTLKHVSYDEAHSFCGAIKEFAANLGKSDFFLAGEVAGGDYNEDRYLDVIGMNLNAALDIGEMRMSLNGVAKGLDAPSRYFNGFDPGHAVMGSHRSLGRRHVSILDDHDHVFGDKLRFSSAAASDHQVVAGVILQLFTLGIPCVYYGTEQALAGPEASETIWLPEWGSSDRYLRETMFGPAHPRKPGKDGLAPTHDGFDTSLPGFGPFGTAGHHCFDEANPVYLRIAAACEARKRYPVLRYGRQYPRPIAETEVESFRDAGAGDLVAWSRILDDEEALCVINANGGEERGARVLVDSDLNPPNSAMTVVLNTAHAAGGGVPYQAGETIPVNRTADGKAYVEIHGLPASEALVLMNHP
ncbi:MAG TPA: alpha-amylase family glycosyl hydrolase [Blastocatellia bacterium]|jgi:glycosidase|nr:alpha-amylase family glycosyl hydrolase [Blastocatellia bacterium]